MPEIVGIIEAELSSFEAPQADPHILIQANGLVLGLFTSAFEYRSRNRPKYQLSRAFVQPWTSDLSLLQSLRHLFDVTVNLRPGDSQVSSKDGEGALGKYNMQQELTDQLRGLAGCLFKVYDDRLGFMDRWVFLC